MITAPGPTVRSRRHLGRDPDDRVLLADDDAAPAELDDDLARIEPEALAGPDRVQQVAGRDGGVAHRRRQPVDLDRPLHHLGAHDLVGDVLQRPQVDRRSRCPCARARRPAPRSGRCRRRRRGRRARCRRASRPPAIGGGGVGDGEREVVVLVDADRDVGRQRLAHRRDPAADVVGQERAGRVDDEDAGAAGVGDDPALPRPCRPRRAGGRCSGGCARSCRARARAEVLDADVGLGAHGRDAHDRRARVAGRLEIALGADARAGSRPRSRRASTTLAAAVSSSASECSGRPYWSELGAEPVAVPDRDRPHAGAVERAPRSCATWSTRYWCAIACEPSRSVVSTMRTRGRAHAAAPGVQLGDAHRGRRS